MEISTSFAQLNASITRPSENEENAEQELNSFGIGLANKPELQLSPQARILNEIDRVNAERQQELDEQLSEQNTSEEEEENSLSGIEVSADESDDKTSVRPSNIAQRALDLYLSIQSYS